MERRKLLILSATGGAGHTRAAEALEETAQSLDLPIQANHYDCLDFTTKGFKRLYSESYLAMVNKAPELWGYLYSRSEMKPYEKKGLLKLFDALNYKNYLKFLLDEKPDALICTHFLPYISISGALRKAGITASVFAATTDFDVHQYWIDSVVKRYYVHTEESAWQLRSKGVTADRIDVKGIPIKKEFASREERSAVRRRLSLYPDRLTILMVWGGFGVGKAEEMAKEVIGMLEIFPEQRFTLLVVCGRNEKLRRRLSEQSPLPHVDTHLFGYVENVHELMSASDVLISKAGGLTSAESMALGIPMIIVDPIPGQETRNAEMIVECRAGWKAMNIANLGYKVKRIVEKPELLEEARAATSFLARPTAARDILSDVYDTVIKGDAR